MHDVAKLAGVSIKTVSNVVNEYPHVRPETRERVQAAIAELDYRLNVSASNLRRGRTGIIGLALPELSLPYFAELAEAVMDAGDEAGLTVVIERTGGTRSGELDTLLGERRAITDGLIFSPLALGQEDEPLLRNSSPLVLLGERVFTERFDHVTMRNVEGARAATEHLLALGRKKIAPLGVHAGEVVGSAALRHEGFRQALNDAGIADDKRLHGETYLWHRFTGASATANILDRGERPDAIFGFNDALALGAISELYSRGIKVPDDIAVIGFDDIDEARYSTPNLSSVDSGRGIIAKSAVQMLVERIGERGSVRKPRTIYAPYRVVTRASTIGIAGQKRV